MCENADYHIIILDVIIITVSALCIDAMVVKPAPRTLGELKNILD